MDNKILTEAYTWLRTPFHHKAMVKGVGVDCAHFLLGVFSAVGMVPVFTPEDYPADWHLHQGEERFLAVIKKYANEVQEPQDGDVVMFQFGRCFSHGAIVVEWPKIIHAYFGMGVVFALYTDAELRGRKHSFWRIR